LKSNLPEIATAATISGESKTVAFQITDDALGFYDNEMNYMVEPGDFVFMVGGSSDDVQQITYNLKE
jgi:beta-glucosidase